VQRVFNRYGHRIGKRECKQVLRRLPTAAVATGWSQTTVLDVTARNAPGALERLLILEPQSEGRDGG